MALTAPNREGLCDMLAMLSGSIIAGIGTWSHFYSRFLPEHGSQNKKKFPRVQSLTKPSKPCEPQDAYQREPRALPHGQGLVRGKISGIRASQPSSELTRVCRLNNN